MKCYTSFIFAILFSIIFSHAADRYEVNEELYVWAQSGMNVRAEPGTGAKILEKLPYGSKVEILEKTDKSYNVVGISGNTELTGEFLKVDPVIFRGNWVKIQTRSGKIGYVIDQYLLRYVPQEQDAERWWELNLKKIQIDTVYKIPVMMDGEGLNSIVETHFQGGVKLITKNGGVWGEDKFIIPNSTIEEVLVLFSANNDNYENYGIIRNWKDELILVVEICEFIIKQRDGQVEMTVNCSC